VPKHPKLSFYNEVMDISLKQRLIGAIVLIALAVIFVPMLLDGSGHKEQVAMGLDIPPEPEFKFEEPLPSLADITSDQAETLSRPRTPQLSQPTQQTNVSEDKSTPSSDDASNVQARKAPPAERHATSAIHFEPARDVESKLEPHSVSTLSNTPVWVAQVGSFKKKDNATALIDKLLAAGYAAFQEKVGDTHAPIYRVKVGPEKNQEGAEAIRNKLYAEFKLKAIVIKQP
jgi:DedD protein